MQVKVQADEGRPVVSETADALAEIQKAVDFSHKGIMRLSENSTRIDSIVSVINDITKRTNLLALNASIIAAQAGEYGKSFGVVADEIRNLSLQTGQSTGEITSIIEEISRSPVQPLKISLRQSIWSRKVLLGTQYGRVSQYDYCKRQSVHGDDRRDHAFYARAGPGYKSGYQFDRRYQFNDVKNFHCFQGTDQCNKEHCSGNCHHQADDTGYGAGDLPSG